MVDLNLVRFEDESTVSRVSTRRILDSSSLCRRKKEAIIQILFVNCNTEELFCSYY